MKPALRNLLNDYGMVFVLLLICAVLSVVTISDQSPEGEAGAMQLVEQLQGRTGASSQVLVAVGHQPTDAEFAAKLEAELKQAGARVTVVQGEPKDAREALQRLASAGAKLDVIACTQSAGAWLVFADVKTDFPALGTPEVMIPRSYRWPNFLKTSNLLNVANQIAIIAILAIGMTMVIITGGIDLSVGSLLALAAVLAARFIRDFAGGVNATTGGMVLACVAAMAVCGGAGAFTGLMVTRFRIPPFIVTLAMMLVGSGLAYTMAGSQTIFQLPESFTWLGREATLLGLPNAVVLMLLLYAVAHVVMARTTLGRYLYAVGGNSEAARISGVPVRRVLMIAYIVCGVLAGLGGVVMASQLKSGSGTYGTMYELYTIAAVVVGGASLSGGQGKMPGTLIGAFTIAVIQNGMNLTNVESQTQKIVLGLVILGAVLLDKFRHTR